jgi:hypothetical protein
VKKKVSGWMRVLVGFGTLGAALTALIAIPGMRTTGRMSNERHAVTMLRLLGAAQKDFREHDRDGDGRRGYWRQDVAGLYSLTHAKSGEPLRLIEISLAEADGAGPEPRPHAGYLYRALRFADEAPADPAVDRFAVAAYPATPASGRTMFILDSAGNAWKKAAVADGLEVFPADPALEGWSPVR